MSEQNEKRTLETNCDGLPIAWLIEGFDQKMNLIAHNVFLKRKDAEDLARSFVGHYPTIRMTALIKGE